MAKRKLLGNSYGFPASMHARTPHRPPPPTLPQRSMASPFIRPLSDAPRSLPGSTHKKKNREKSETALQNRTGKRGQQYESGNRRKRDISKSSRRSRTDFAATRIEMLTQPIARYPPPRQTRYTGAKRGSPGGANTSAGAGGDKMTPKEREGEAAAAAAAGSLRRRRSTHEVPQIRR